MTSLVWRMGDDRITADHPVQSHGGMRWVGASMPVRRAIRRRGWPMTNTGEESHALSRL